MRGKLSEQDLTNYALNEGLDPRERLYVESMLGASEPCRDDVYKMLEPEKNSTTRGYEGRDIAYAEIDASRLRFQSSA